MSAFSSPATWSRKQLRADRVSVSMQVKIVTLSTYQFPELANISSSGVKVRGDNFSPKGTIAILKAGSLEVLCRVVRIAGNECGLRFEEPVSPAAIKRIQLEGAVELASLTSDSEGRGER